MLAALSGIMPLFYQLSDTYEFLCVFNSLLIAHVPDLADNCDLLVLAVRLSHCLLERQLVLGIHLELFELARVHVEPEEVRRVALTKARSRPAAVMWFVLT